MRVAELIMLIVGAVLFTVSFFMPDKKGGAELDKEEERKQIKKLLDESASEAKFKVEEAVDDSVSDGCDRAERALDRLTNEKISAIGEYSDTVLEQIKKNHDEVMFLYDMLNNKHAQVKNTAAEVSQLAKSAKAANEEAASSKGFGYVTPNPERSGDNKGFGYTDASVASKPSAETKKEEKPATEKTNKPFTQGIGEKQQAEETAEKKKASKAKQPKTPVADGNIELMFAADNNSANSNDRILELHKAGKSNMAIAKELGLGVGEVKLVIDLFEGI